MARQEESATSSVIANAAGGPLDLCVPALETHSHNTAGQADTVPAPSPPKQEELYGRLAEGKEAMVSRCQSVEIHARQIAYLG